MRKLIAAAGLALAVATPAVAQETTLRWFTIFDANYVKLFEPVIAAYEAENPGIKIEMETVAGSGAAVYPDVLRTSMASGDPPDLFFMWGGSIAQPFIDADQVRPLNEAYEQYGWTERYAPWIIDRLSQNGVLYGVPFRARGMAIWYRKDMFEEHGLSVPATYEELEGICETLAENGKYCASFGGKFGWHTMRLVDYFLEDTCGPEVHNALNAREESWDQPCVVEAFDRLKKWVDNRWLVPDFLAVAPNDARMPMFLGDAAMVYEGGWFENVLKNDQQDPTNYDFFLPPTESGRYHAFPEQWMVPTGARNPEAALDFIDWMTSAETQQEFPVAFEGSPTIGVTPDCSVAPHGCKWVEILSSDRGTYPPTDQAFAKELIDGFFEAQDSVVAGRMTGEQAAALIQQRVEQYDR
jgi:raffinose/stachyose/melibiose transport system substrate-binding protein